MMPMFITLPMSVSFLGTNVARHSEGNEQADYKGGQKYKEEERFTTSGNWRGKDNSLKHARESCKAESGH